MSYVLTLLVASILHRAVASGTNSHCEKTTRLSLGRDKRIELRVVAGGTCKRQLQAPFGLFVKVFFEELPAHACQGELTVNESLATPIQPNTISIRKYIRVEPGAAEIYETSSVSIGYVSSSQDDCRIPLMGTAVVPKGGICGFETDASDSIERFRSPGFPRVNAPAGLRCVWILRSRSDQYIRLDIKTFMTHYRDYLEIYDGTQQIERLSGKYQSYMILQHFAYSGEMRIYFYTKTSKSGGFKAKFKAIRVKEEVEELTWRGEISTRVLQCHRRRKLELNGRLFWDSHSKTACPTGNVCSLVRAVGRNVKFPGVEAVTEIAQCIPVELCNSTCNQSTIQDVEIDSCNAFCCASGLCNKYAGWLEDPPNEGLQCNKRSRKLRSDGRGAGSYDGTGKPCAPGNVCGLYVYEGSTKDSSSERQEVSGYEAKCVQPKACSAEACKNRYGARSINVTSCTASCCTGYRCNQPPESIPTPTPAGSVSRCHYIIRGYSGNEMVSNFTKIEECYDFNSRCLRIDATVIDRYGTDLKVTQAKCMSKRSCDELEGCKLVTDTLEQTTPKSCRASCCDSDLCNGDSEVASETARLRV